MDEAQNDILGLMSACKKCLTPCCNDKYFLSLPGERDAIVAAGHLDHFTKVKTSLGDHYVLDFQNDDCAYLGPEGCTLGDVKPTTCRAYPAYLTSKNEVMAHPSCRGHKQVSENYLKNAKPLLVRYKEVYPDDMHASIMQEYKKQRELALKNQ